VGAGAYSKQETQPVRLCFEYKNEGSCSRGKQCPYSHDDTLHRKTVEQEFLKLSRLHFFDLARLTESYRNNTKTAATKSPQTPTSRSSDKQALTARPAYKTAAHFEISAQQMPGFDWLNGPSKQATFEYFDSDGIQNAQVNEVEEAEQEEG